MDGGGMIVSLTWPGAFAIVGGAFAFVALIHVIIKGMP